MGKFKELSDEETYDGDALPDLTLTPEEIEDFRKRSALHDIEEAERRLRVLGPQVEALRSLIIRIKDTLK